MYRVVTLIIVLGSFLFAGCSTTYSVNYIPSSSIRGNGAVSLNTFRYLPAEKGEVASNEFQKASGAMGYIYLSEPIPDIIRNAMRKEFVMSGFTVEPGSNLTIEADINRFLYDWIGFVEVDYYLDVTFRVLQGKELLLTYAASSHQKTPKMVDQIPEAIKALISKCFDDFFLEARAKKIF